jgi:hypothetical protein
MTDAFLIQNDKTQRTRRGHTGQADSIIDLTLFNFPAEENKVFIDSFGQLFPSRLFDFYGFS